jgi:hypothetical protein
MRSLHLDVNRLSGNLARSLPDTRAGHLGLTHLCTCRKNLSAPAGLGQLVTIRIVISFLEDAVLLSVFAIPFA